MLVFGWQLINQKQWLLWSFRWPFLFRITWDRNSIIWIEVKLPSFFHSQRGWNFSHKKCAISWMNIWTSFEYCGPSQVVWTEGNEELHLHDCARYQKLVFEPFIWKRILSQFDAVSLRGSYWEEGKPSSGSFPGTMPGTMRGSSFPRETYTISD